ncbi:MAG: flagellar biosynthesis anti-sigma factor FlgM [Chitinivibrionales bacterium]|nr:flagellar biosynthesis anti-sigma factor FlgM [Chitinivibrionales bacterium]
MRIHSVTEAFNAELRKTSQVRRNEKPQARAKQADQSDFSSKAQRLSNTKAEMQAVKAHVDLQPEIREAKVAEVRQKIEQGYYNSEQFMDKLADKLIKDFGLDS